MKITREQVEAVLAATYQYWDGYYIPSETGWTEEKLIDQIIEEVNSND